MDISSLNRLANASPKLKELLNLALLEINRLVKGEKNSEEILEQLLGRVTERPLHWSPNSSAGYYKEKYAKILLGWLAEMENSEGKSKLIRSDKLHKTNESIVNQVSQSWQWIIDNEKDNDKKRGLIALKESLECRKVKEGVIISYRPVIDFSGDMIEESSKGNSKWKTELQNFLESCVEGQILEIGRLMLEEHDLEYVKILINGMKDIVPLEISSFKLRIIKSSFLYNKMLG